MGAERLNLAPSVLPPTFVERTAFVAPSAPPVERFSDTTGPHGIPQARVQKFAREREGLRLGKSRVDHDFD
jgi:hypothetical protein